MNKFISPCGHSLEEGAITISYAWNTLHETWKEKETEIFKVTRSVDRAINNKLYPPAHFSVNAEKALAEIAPEVFCAINAFRNAITFLDGRDIDWWHFQGAKPVRRMEPDMIEGIVEGNTLIDDGYSYGRFSGRVLGSEVGFNNIFQNMGVWVEIEHTEPSQFKIRHPFEAMYGIELISVNSNC